jgi:hypothetical protein
VFLLADFVPTTRPECVFPEAYQGDWLLFEDKMRDEVNIFAGYATFASLGEFICKAKHWEALHYKLFSHYTNGW